jgi:hypothetical protein
MLFGTMLTNAIEFLGCFSFFFFFVADSSPVLDDFCSFFLSLGLSVFDSLLGFSFFSSF